MALKRMHLVRGALNQSACGGYYDLHGLLTFIPAHVTCRRCLQVLAKRRWPTARRQFKLMRPNSEVLHIDTHRGAVQHRIDRNVMRRTQPGWE